MFKHLLVPLDGSSLAEVVLPAVAYLAQTMGARATLLHIVEHNAPPVVHGERHLTNLAEANTYLTEVAQRAFPPPVPVEQHVHMGETSGVASTIAEHAEELSADLTVLCAHGRGGLSSWLVGRIAQRVVACGKKPVLLIQPNPGGSASTFACRRLLAPLDGKPTHEQGLTVAAGLAHACAATLHLVMVVPTLQTLPAEQAATGKLLPGATSAWLDLTQQEGEAYLHRWAAQLQSSGLGVTTEVDRGAPAKTIVQTAQRVQADLIVLATHGKKGLEAFWADSVAAKILGQTRLPLLLVPVGGVT